MWVEPSADNAVRVFAALSEFGAPLGDLSAEDLARPGLIFQIGVPPNRIDIITSIDGVGFTEAGEGRARMDYGGWPIAVIGREALLKNKRATGRPQDLIDVLMIERHSP